MASKNKRSKSEILRRYWDHVKNVQTFSGVSLKEARKKYSSYVKVRDHYRKQAAASKKAGRLGEYAEFKALFNETVSGERKREGYLPVPETDYYTGESPD